MVKINLILLAGVLLSLMLAGLASADTINSCMALDKQAEVYTLDSDVVSAGTCFSVGADAVTLNCNGHKVTYSALGAGNGILIDNFDRVIVENCVFVQGSKSSNSDAVRLQDSDGSVILSNDISTIGEFSLGVWVEKGFGVSVANNKIRTGGKNSNGLAIYLASSKNVILKNDISTANGIGVSIFDGTDNQVMENKFSGNSLDLYIRDGTIGEYSFGNSTLLIEDPNYGIINFKNKISSSGSDLTQDVGIMFNLADIPPKDDFADASSEITLYRTDSLGLEKKDAWRNNGICQSSICTMISGGDSFKFDATRCGNYSVGFYSGTGVNEPNGNSGGNSGDNGGNSENNGTIPNNPNNPDNSDNQTTTNETNTNQTTTNENTNQTTTNETNTNQTTTNENTNQTTTNETNTNPPEQYNQSNINLVIAPPSLVPMDDYYSEFEIIGASLTRGVSYQMPITVKIHIGNDTFEPWGGYMTPVTSNVNDGKNPRFFYDARKYFAGTPISIDAKSWKKRKSYYDGKNNDNWMVFSEANSTDSIGAVKILKNGDDVPITKGGAFDQSSVNDYLVNYITSDGKIKLGSNQAIYLFELGEANYNSAAADWQDLVVLATLSKTPIVSGQSIQSNNTGLIGYLVKIFGSDGKTSIISLLVIGLFFYIVLVVYKKLIGK